MVSMALLINSLSLLQEDVNFATWTGKKDIGENLAVLPTMIYGINEDGSPKVAQWNYKILAHPLTTEVPLNRYKSVFLLLRIIEQLKTDGANIWVFEKLTYLKDLKDSRISRLRWPLGLTLYNWR